jgi:hypothetical protein
MLTRESLNANVVLANNFAKRGLVLSPKEGTPVKQLINAAHIPEPARVVNGGLDELDVEESIIKGSLHKDPQGICHHDLLMDEIVECVAKTVQSNLDLARNRVNPLIKEIVHETQVGLDSIETVGAAKVNIVPRNWHPIWNNNILGELISRYDETPVDNLKLDLIIPTPDSREGYLTILKTGIGRLDRDIESWFDQLPEGFVKYVFTSAFGDTLTGEHHTNNLTDLVTHFNGGIDHANRVLLVHLFSRHLLENIPEGVQRSLDEYRVYMSKIMAQSGRALNRFIERRKRNQKNRILLTKYPEENGLVGYNECTIEVNGDVYPQWLESGGEPDVLLGALVSDKETGFNSLIERKEQYIKAWQKHERMLNIRVHNERHNNAVEAFKRAVIKVISELDETIRMAPDAIYRQRLLECTERLEQGWYNDLYRSVRKVVCHVFFPHTDAYQILCAIDEAAEANPGIEIREAGYLAVINIVAEWVAKLIEVEPAAAI